MQLPLKILFRYPSEQQRFDDFWYSLLIEQVGFYGCFLCPLASFATKGHKKHP
jgi:hypothetical protein